LWDRIIEEGCNIALGTNPADCETIYYGISVQQPIVNFKSYRSGKTRFRVTTISVTVCLEKGRQIYHHYNRLRNHKWEGDPTISYLQFLDMLDDPITAIDKNSKIWSHTCKREGVPSKLGSEVVEHISSTLKKLIDDMPKFSSFLASSQKDGDVGFERDTSDSEGEEDGSG